MAQVFTSGNAAGVCDDDRARAVLVSSADRPFKGDEKTPSRMSDTD